MADLRRRRRWGRRADRAIDTAECGCCLLDGCSVLTLAAATAVAIARRRRRT